MNIKNLLFATLLLLFSCDKAQELKAGLILPSDQEKIYTEEFCCVLSPDQGFSVYSKPSGNKIGVLKRMNSKTDDQNSYQIYFWTGSIKKEFTDHKQVGYEIAALTYTDVSNGYVKLSGSDTYWLSVEEIERSDFKKVSWRDYLIQNKDKVLGYYADEPGLNVRKEANEKSEIIGSVRGDLFEINLTTQISGLWCKAKIRKFRQHPCQSDVKEEQNIEFEYDGWIKILDDNGEPNIWSYTKGC